MVSEKEQQIMHRLAQMRKESGVTYYSIKKNTGIPKHAIKAIERGSRSCVLKTIIRLLEQYGRTPNELFNGME